MLTFFSFFVVILTLVFLFFAIRGEHRFYWLAAVCCYIFSFFSGFSIGQMTVGLVFLFVVLAIGYSCQLIKSSFHLVVFILTGLFIGFVMVMYVDDYWLFYPFTFFT